MTYVNDNRVLAAVIGRNGVYCAQGGYHTADHIAGLLTRLDEVRDIMLNQYHMQEIVYESVRLAVMLHADVSAEGRGARRHPDHYTRLLLDNADAAEALDLAPQMRVLYRDILHNAAARRVVTLQDALFQDLSKAQLAGYRVGDAILRLMQEEIRYSRPEYVNKYIPKLMTAFKRMYTSGASVFCLPDLERRYRPRLRQALENYYRPADPRRVL